MLIFRRRRNVIRNEEPAGARLSKLLAAGACLLFTAVINTPVVAAQNSSSQTAAALAQSFELSGDSKSLVAGSLVSSKPGNKNSVELASVDNGEYLLGIVADDPLVTIVDNKNTISVVISGKAMALVSDINGPLKSGDKVTASPVAGIGMKATLNSQVVGTVQASQSKDNASTTRSVKDTDGKAHTIKISTLPIQLSVGYYQPPGGNLIPTAVQRTANNIAGKPVPVVRIIIASIIMLASMCSIIALMYASGRNSILAIGRNPLAASLVYKGMYRVGVLAVIILVFGTLLSFVLLKI